MSFKPEVQAALDNFDPVIKSILIANQDQRPLMAVRNIEHLITTIDANKTVITPEVFSQIMSELGKDSLVELTDIYKVRNRLTALISDLGGNKSSAAPSPAVSAAPSATPLPVESKVTEAKATPKSEEALTSAFSDVTEEVKEVLGASSASVKKLTATKNPVMTVEDRTPAPVAAEPTVVEAIVETPAVETPEVETAEESGSFIDTIATELPPFPTTSTVETPTVINVTAEPTTLEEVAESAGEATPARRGRKPGMPATRSNVDNLVLQLLNKLEEKDARITELEKRVDELEQDAASSVKITPALAKRLEKFGIQV